MITIADLWKKLFNLIIQIFAYVRKIDCGTFLNKLGTDKRSHARFII
jgi:hypothetical protein